MFCALGLAEDLVDVLFPGTGRQLRRAALARAPSLGVTASACRPLFGVVPADCSAGGGWDRERPWWWPCGRAVPRRDPPGRDGLGRSDAGDAEGNDLRYAGEDAGRSSGRQLGHL